MSRLPPRLLTKPIFFPSGDHAGWPSRAGLRVRLRSPAAVDADHVDLVVAVAIADEGDPLSVGRPGERAVAVREARQLALLGAVGVHDVQDLLPPAPSERPFVAIAPERDRPPVR